MNRERAIRILKMAERKTLSKKNPLFKEAISHLESLEIPIYRSIKGMQRIYKTK